MYHNIMKTKCKIGVIFGKFYPLHCGHIYLIEKAITQVEVLHVFLGCEQLRDLKLFEASHMPRQPQVSDRFYWLKRTFQNHQNIYIHVLNEEGIADYPNGWKDWSDRVKAILAKNQVKPTVIFTSEQQDVVEYERFFHCTVKLIDVNRDFINISATQIRDNPYKNWQYLAKAARPFFVTKIALVSKQNQFDVIAQQLANIFNTVYVNNGYSNYFHYDHYGKIPISVTADDYIRIAKLQAQRIDEAALNANRVLFTALDFVTLQQSFQNMFHKEDQTLNELINKYPFDLVINYHDFNSKHSQLSIFEAVIEQVRNQLN